MRISIQETEALINHYVNSKKLRGEKVQKEDVKKYMERLFIEKNYESFPNLIENLLNEMNF